MKLLASSGFEAEVINIIYGPKTIFTEPFIQVVMKGGILGKSKKFHKNDFSEVAVVDESQSSSDGAQRARNAAIGVVLLGPLGLLGATMGGAKTQMKVRFVTKSGEQVLVELNSKKCKEVLKSLMGISLEQVMNEKLLKSG